MKKEKNPYVDENYRPYEDERWVSIPNVNVLQINVKQTEEQQKKAENFKKFIEEQDTKLK